MRGDMYIMGENGLEFHSGEDGSVTLLKTHQELLRERLERIKDHYKGR